MNIRICHMYPDVLNLYGDRGNVISIKQRLERRGFNTEIIELPIGERNCLTGIDFVFIGGGQDFDQEILLTDLAGEKTENLKSAIEDGLPVLAICGGYQLLGKHYETYDGVMCDFTGALDIFTVGGKRRMVGNMEFICDEMSGGSVVVGFENHSGRTYLGSDMTPLGRIVSGFGNNGEDRTEGLRYKNVFGSYCHGPMLPKNPSFCDFLLSCILERKMGNGSLEELDDRIELLAHKELLRKIQKKPHACR